jgi:hypothetical protein
MGHWDAAVQHFEDALVMNARMEAWPWLAHTQYAYATMLLARNQPGDGDKATALLDAALRTARELSTWTKLISYFRPADPQCLRETI